jgi:hypothetical protein
MNKYNTGGRKMKYPSTMRIDGSYPKKGTQFWAVEQSYSENSGRSWEKRILLLIERPNPQYTTYSTGNMIYGSLSDPWLVVCDGEGHLKKYKEATCQKK